MQYAIFPPPKILYAWLCASTLLVSSVAAADRPGIPVDAGANGTARIVVLRDAADAGDIIGLAQAMDGSAAVRHRSALLPGHVWMTLDAETAKQLRLDPRVARVMTERESPPSGFAGNSADPVFRHLRGEPGTPAPLSADPGAGKGVRIAIISTGVDYTHAALGGDGNAETYATAITNATTLWPGFPTAVVTGGLDVASEGGRIDPNPIEFSTEGVDLSRYPSIPAGRGTQMAGVVHALAPGAELLAYKIWFIVPNGRGELNTRYVDSVDMDRVFTHILDPNGDGDRSDRADIALLDSLGGLAFHSPFEEDDSPDSVLIDSVQALAAQGVLVVTDSGSLAPESRYGISWQGAAPDALTVGAMQTAEGSVYAAAPISARGPVRGRAASIKPDIVGTGVDVTVAVAGGGDATATTSSGWIAAANVAATAAVLKQRFPALSALQLKTLLANTARHDVRAALASDAALAEVPVVGMGRLDLDAALAARALFYSEGNYQPSVNFGFHELTRTTQYQRQLVIHNLSDTDRVFRLEHEIIGDKAGNAALAIAHPATVSVPAHHQVTLPFEITVDPERLPPWPLIATGDYADAAWREVQLNGYLIATDDDGNTLSLGWLVTPRATSSMRKDFASLVLLSDSPLKTGFADFVEVLRQDFVNDGPASASYLALPLIAEHRDPPAYFDRRFGHFLKYVGGGVFDEPACAVTGRKLVLGVSMHRPAEVAAANYFEKIGDPIFYFEIFREDAVENYGYDDGIGPGNVGLMTDADYINYGWVSLDERGAPVTVTIDLDMTFDPANPTARYQVSSLPALMPTHSRNAVAQVCLEDLFHHDFIDESELDRNLGFTFATDRDVIPATDTPIIRFNPVRYGYMQDAGLAVVNLGAKVSLNRAGDEETFSSTLTLAPGERGTLTAAKDAVCDSVGLVRATCMRTFLLLGLNSDYALSSKVLPGDASTIAFVKPGQSFDVSEAAQAGELVGRVTLDADGFFAEGPGMAGSEFGVYQVNALPGDPLRVAPNGDIIVANPAAIDHEQQDHFRLHVRTEKGNDKTSAAEVLVRVSNVNDVAPDYLGGLERIDAVPGMKLDLALAPHFTDDDGDMLTFTVTGLPPDLAFDESAGRITGKVATSGAYSLHIVATDGSHETGTDLALVVTSVEQPRPGTGGGGAPGWPLLLLSLAAFFRHRGDSVMKKHVLCITIGCLFGCLLIGAAATPAHAEISALNKRQGVSATERDVRVDDKPLYFVHLRGVALAMHARENLAATEAFSEGRLQVNAPANRQYTQLLEARQHDVLAQIQQLSGSAPRVLARHTLALNALVLAMDGRDAERIAALPDVVRVERIYRSQLHTDRGPAHIGAIDAWDGVGTLPGNQGEGVIVGIIDTGIRTDHPAFADIGGDGYDHTNPLGAGNYLGDCIRNARLCNDKLIGVVSYPEITDSYGGLRPANGTDYNGHGTHVASTAAGNILNNVAILDDAGGNSYRIPRVSGVAPHANIVAYQVCFPANGGCLPQLAVKAVEHAIANGVDVINYSVGSEAFSPWESAAAMAFLSARAAGIHVATSAGNFGPDPSTLGTPANAPWITSVAAYTHDRDYTLPSLTGFIGGTPPRAALQGKGVTNEYTGTVVLASGYRDALCSTPFPRGTFNGEIVVCERGVIPRVDKGRNVLAGGAGGMILINTRNTDDETFADFHVLPALHLDSASAATLLAWLQSGGQTATITAAGPVSNSVLADIAGNFSSRGPALPFGNLPGPDVAAPGVDILAAWIRDVPFTPGNLVADFAFLNGTSMSSPHVAGVLALLTGMHPDWMPAEMQSALITTAESNTLSNRERSTTFDHGGGRIDVPAAALAGLVMDVAEAEYLAADPAAGGDPAALNQPILIQESCMLECEWTRTVKAVVNGTWNASATAATGLVISVEPATFTLAAGQRQALTIRATLAEGGGTVWRHGRVALMQTGIGAVSPTEMPVSVRLQSGAAPAFVTLEARADAGSAPLNGFRSIGTDSLQIRADGLSKAALYEAFLSQDPTPDAPVDVLDGVV
ncbi:MAG TPA: S8 family serine peptidase [Gammaproteobacteria bacterium]